MSGDTEEAPDEMALNSEAALTRLHSWSFQSDSRFFAAGASDDYLMPSRAAATTASDLADEC